MKLTDPQVLDLLADIDVRSGRDTAVAFDLMLTALVAWTARYAGCAPLLDCAINVLTESKREVVEALRGMAS